MTDQKPLRFGVRSIGIALKARRLERFLGGCYRFEFLPPGVPAPKDIDGMAGWGVKGAAKPEAFRLGLPYLSLEDGFLSTAGLGGRSDPALCLTADLIGTHFDSSRPSQAEQLIETSPEPEGDELEQVRQLIALMRSANLGKYNGAPDVEDDDPLFADGPPVIVVDQIRGDHSISCGGCSPDTFAQMLNAALAENPGAPVFARVHPVDGKKRGRRGHLRELAEQRGVRLFDRNVSWMSVAKRAKRVYVATSAAGLEALIAGTRVTCFGLPIYAGWGLTDDRQAAQRRTARPSLEALVACLYLRYPRYLSPLDGEPCSALEVARLLAARRRRDSAVAGTNHLLGVHRWKDFHVEPFVKGARSQVTYTMEAEVALERQRTHGGRIIVWASREPEGLAERCEAQGAPLLRMEDGFLRSVGLGANLEPPSSLVLDSRGIYYDPSRPSDLEHILATAEFSPTLLKEAASLRRRIVEARISKYNVGSGAVAEAFAAAGQRRRVLVPGQVENDASVMRGGGTVRSNLALLQAAREARPDAYIVYKPHPDVESGLRPGALSEAEVLRYADRIAPKASIAHLLDQAQELHTLTSLSGFEALLKGVRVATYGMPFYAGWGLTEDRERCERRNRDLNLDQLVAGTLILYPMYVHRPSGWPCNALDVVNFLAFSLLRSDPVGLIRRNRSGPLLRRWLGRRGKPSGG